MNSSVYSADRATYLRIVLVALLASIAVVGFAISARTSDGIGDDRSAQAMSGAYTWRPYTWRPYAWRAELPNHNAAVPARPDAARPI